MKSKKTLSALLLALVMVTCLVMAQVVTVGAETSPAPATAESVYETNKDLVAAIDDGGYYAKLYALAQDDDSYVAKMQSIADVAAEYEALVEDYVEEDYFVRDWSGASGIVHEKELTKSRIVLTEDNYRTYDAEKASERIEKARNYIENNFVTLSVSYETEKANAKAYIETLYNDLLSKNTANPGGSPEKIVGYYDNNGKAELGSVKGAFDDDLDALALDKSDYNGSVNAVTALRDQAEADLRAVRLNDVERTYDLLQDYYAILNGDREGDAAGEKNVLTSDINRLDRYFWKNASPEILTKYSNEKKAFEDFLTETTIDDSAYRDRSYIETADKVVRIDAMDEAGNPLEVIPAKAILKATNVADAAAKRRNAELAINEVRDGISVAYLMDLTIYNPVERWNTVKKHENKKVIYRVTVMLENYYKKYVKGNRSFLTGILASMGLSQPVGSDRSEAIASYAKYLNSHDGSLCYSYDRGTGDGKAVELDYSYAAGNLTFDVDDYGTFVIAVNEKSSILLNPWLYLICLAGLALLIIIIVLIVKFSGYKIVFVTNGGSKVKSVRGRKGESFVMPENPKKKDYVFAGWFEDKEFRYRFVRTQIDRRGKVKVYARWFKAFGDNERNDLFKKICADFEAHKTLPATSDKDSIVVAKAYNGENGIKLYLAIELTGEEQALYGAVAEESSEFATKPWMLLIDSKENYESGKKLIEKAYVGYALESSAPDEELLANLGDTYVLTATKPVAKEEPAEAVVGAAEEEPANEQPVEQAEEQPVDEEKLNDYYAGIRRAARGYGLAKDSDKAKEGMMLLRAYCLSDGVYVYLALDPEAEGLEKAEGKLAEGTPALFKVTDDESYEKALELIDKTMTGYDLEKTGMEVGELTEGLSKGFGYRLKFQD